MIPQYQFNLNADPLLMQNNGQPVDYATAIEVELTGRISFVVITRHVLLVLGYGSRALFVLYNVDSSEIKRVNRMSLAAPLQG